jgi:hypothetical protein
MQSDPTTPADANAEQLSEKARDANGQTGGGQRKVPPTEHRNPMSAQTLPRRGSEQDDLNPDALDAPISGISDTSQAPAADPTAPTEAWRAGDEAPYTPYAGQAVAHPQVYLPAGHGKPRTYHALGARPPFPPHPDSNRQQAAPHLTPAPYLPPSHLSPNEAKQQRGIPVTLGVVAIALVVTIVVLVLVGRAIQRPHTAVLYQNSLRAATSGWRDDPLHRDCFFQSDGYHIVTATNCYYSDADYTDVTIAATARLTSGDTSGAYGLAFRRPSKDNYYAFYITGTGSWFLAKQETILRPSTPNAAIKSGLGAVNRMEVRLHGSHFDLFVNGTQVGSADDGSYSEGKVGLVGDQNMSAVYTDFSITQG